MEQELNKTMTHPPLPSLSTDQSTWAWDWKPNVPINRIQESTLSTKEPFLKTINCLDKGFVRLVDWMGSDQRIVQAARVSYGSGTKSVREDAGLIDYLLRHAHTSPFEQVSFTFHVKMPIFVARQLVRHRTQKINELSGRYSVLNDEFYVPEVSRMQKQSSENKQGSGQELIDFPEDYLDSMIADQQLAYTSYQGYLDSGMARELSRINLPLSTYTEWYTSIDLHNLFHLLKLRLDPHAQYEIRVIAQAKYDLIKPIVPLACESFQRHVINGRRFSEDEMNIIKELIQDIDLENFVQEKKWKKSKIDEFTQKIK